METPQTKDFSAWIDLIPGTESRIIVEGEVLTKGGNMVPELCEAEPDATEGAGEVLRLDLTIEDTGKPGTMDINFRPARFETAAAPGQYRRVEIVHEGETKEQLEVVEVR